MSAAVLPNAVNGPYAVCLQQQLQQVVSAAAGAVVVVVDGDVPAGHVTAAPLLWGPSGASVHRLGYPGCDGTYGAHNCDVTNSERHMCTHKVKSNKELN